MRPLLEWIDRGAVAAPAIVGIVLVRNEDAFVEQALRNVAAFCDRIHAVDHVSTDRTWEILQALGRELDHLDVRRTAHADESHALVEQYAGTDTWIFGVDGDELYDPERLAALPRAAAGRVVRRRLQGRVERRQLRRGRSRRGRRATGYPSPPSRSITKLYNFAAIDSWAGDGSERLHGGTIAFRPGYDDGSVDNISERLTWEETPLRCLHLCFVPRSSLDSDAPAPRPILMESGLHDRTWIGAAKRRLLRRQGPAESAWKQEKYMRGELVTVDASPFFS